MTDYVVTLAVSGDVPLSRPLHVAVYRVAQGDLNNVVRHDSAPSSSSSYLRLGSFGRAPGGRYLTISLVPALTAETLPALSVAVAVTA